MLSLQDRASLGDNNFGDPVRRLFPIITQEDVNKSASRIRRQKNRNELKDNIIKIAASKGFSVPQELTSLDKQDDEGNLIKDKVEEDINSSKINNKIKKI